MRILDCSDMTQALFFFFRGWGGEESWTCLYSTEFWHMVGLPFSQLLQKDTRDF